MKFYLIVATIAIFLSSCLKQSIPDAMLDSQQSGGGSNVTATLSYEWNGNPVKTSMADAGSQNINNYTLACAELSPGFYFFDGVSNTGEFTFPFVTDSLTTGKYTYTGSSGTRFLISYNNRDAYAYSPTDSLNFTITSYKKGYISGYFSGKLTPLITAGAVSNTYGSPSSIIITKGLFKNIPVIY